MATTKPRMATWLQHLLLLIIAPMVTMACPQGCQCYSDVPSVHCYNLGITAVPSGFPPNTTLLAIRHCNVTALRRGDFSGMPLLATLYLGWNNISTIEPGTFDGLFNLKFLSFGANHVAKLTPGLFKDNKLSDLDASDNKIEAIPSGLFTNHSSLISLILNGNRISMLGDSAFAGLPRLGQIQINDNLIPRVPAGTFTGTSKLWTLEMARNAISVIENGAFSDTTLLNILDVSDNQIMTLEGTLKGLSQLNSLTASGNRIVEITNSTLTSLTSLRDAWLNNNKIRKIESGAFKGMGNLNNFFLGQNLEEMPLNNLVGILKLDLADNRLQTPPLNMTVADQLAFLWLSGNPLKSLEPSQFQSLKGIYELDLNNVSAVREGRMDPRALCGVPTLASLFMNNNNITSFPKDLLTCTTGISYLSLAGNRITTFKKDDFYTLSNMYELDLSDNSINNISSLSTALESIPSLEHLTLTGNPMVYLPKKAFPANIEIDNLLLNNMKLRAVDKDAFEWMGKLKAVDMGKNRLKFIPGKLFANVSVQKVNLDDNPWQCDCQMYEFAQWMKTSNISENLEVVCEGPAMLKGKDLSEIPLDKLTCDCVHYQEPTINTTGSDTHVPVGHPARLVCNVTGCPEAAVIWTTPLGDVFSEDSDDPRVSVLSDGGLEIRETNLQDAGMYTCMAINYLGMNQESIGLNVTNSATIH